MRKLIITACAAALAAPVAAQPPRDPIEEDIVHSLPRREQIESVAPVIDRSVDALLNLDVGPIMDAADPLARSPAYGRPGRTLRNLGRRDDPYFDRRIRSSIYGATAEMSRMSGAFAAAAPALAHAVRDMQRGLAAAIDDYHRRSGDVPPPPEDEYGPDDE